MSAAHTPGPWIATAEIRDGEFNVREKKSTGGYAPLAKVIGDRRNTKAQAEANARLIAAAPELLEALQAIVKSLADQDDEGMIEHAQQMIEARAAIAKATGETK